MEFDTPLIPARLIRRYKRFLADVRLADGREVTAHCANPGSMTGLAEPDTKVWLEPNDDPKRKLKCGWRLVEHETGHFTGVDTSIPNRVLKAALLAHDVPGLPAYETVHPEVKFAQGSRVDFVLRGAGLVTYLEVKSVTLSPQPGVAAFPDSVTARGTRHLEALAEMAAAGHEAVMFYLVQRTDCARMTLADGIDPAYCTAFHKATRAGVRIRAHACRISPEAITLGDPVEVAP